MLQISDLIKPAIDNKSKLIPYFFGSKRKLPENLQKYQKHELNAMLLLTLSNAPELCRFLKTPFNELEDLINNPIYSQFSVKKKKGGQRQICAPNHQLKVIQKRLNYFLQAYYLCVKPDEVHGFVINPHYMINQSNIVANAKIHIGKKQVLNIDIKDFFPSISAHRVYNTFQSASFGFDKQVATALTLLSTFEGKLPTGSPTSPVISNFICSELDKDLNQFCKVNQLNYTRYADDLTFSSNTKITDDCILDIINLIHKNNFQINEKKLRLKPSNRKQTVTGLTVNENVNVDRKLLKKIRAMLHDLSTNGLDSATKSHFKLNQDIDEKLREKFIYKLEGYINFVRQVRGNHDALYQKMKSVFDNEFVSLKSES